MMKYIAILFFFLMCQACHNNTDSIYENAIRIYLTDSLKKLNITIDSIVINRVDTITDKIIGQYIIRQNINMVEYYNDLTRLSLSLAKTKGDQYRIYQSLSHFTLTEMAKRELNENLDLVNRYRDSAQLYSHFADSALKNIQKRDSIKPIYMQVHPLIYGSQNKVINYLDSTPIFFANNKIVTNLTIKYDFIRN